MNVSLGNTSTAKHCVLRTSSLMFSNRRDSGKECGKMGHGWDKDGGGKGKNHNISKTSNYQYVLSNYYLACIVL